MATRTDILAKRWQREHGRYENLAYRIVQDGVRKMAMDLPPSGLTPAMFPATIATNITPEKFAPLVARVWTEVGTQAAIRQNTEIMRDLGQKALPTPEEVRAIISRLLTQRRRNDLSSMSRTFQRYLIAQLTSYYTAIGEYNQVLAMFLASIASSMFYRPQSARIARTESTGAANYGQYASTQLLGLATEKTWLTMLDERVRARPYPGFNHRVLHGVTIGSEDLFSQGGVSLSFPGDPLAAPPSRAAGMIINCRCLAVYTPVRSRGRIRLR